MKHQSAGGGTLTSASSAAQYRRDQAITGLKQLIETPQAAKPGGKRHFAQGQIGIRQQPFGLQQAV